MGPVGRPGEQLSVAPASAAALAEAGSVAGLSPRDVLVAVTVAEAAALGVAVAHLGPLGEAGTGWPLGLPAIGSVGAAMAPDRLGAVHEALLGAVHRRGHGVHYTPAAVADTIVALAFDQLPSRRLCAPLVCDPACGGGAFLLAAARGLQARGTPAGEVLDLLYGFEVDPLAADVTVAALRLWAMTAGGGSPISDHPGPFVRVVDAMELGDWATPQGAATAIVGNPPFGGQLARRTARGAEAVAASKRRLGVSAGYADTAAMFLARAAEEVAAGGVVALVQPLSLLGTRDAGVVRRGIGAGRLAGLWVPDRKVFSASVAVCAPILVDGARDAPLADAVPVVRGVARDEVARVPRARLAAHDSWSPLWAAGAGVPVVDLDGGRTVADWCSATAGFRDEFYALADLVVDDPDPRPAERPEAGTVRVLTSGLVDPGTTSWGSRPARIAGRVFGAPVVTVASAQASTERRLSAVVSARSAPKVIVATQTRVVEAVVDDDGRFWPSVPLVSLHLRSEMDDSEHRWLLAAALMAPPVTAWVLARVGGAARSPDAVKLSARQALLVPLPVDRVAWTEGAMTLRDAARSVGAGAVDEAVGDAGAVLTAAYGLSGSSAQHLLAWWRARLGSTAQLIRS